MSAVRDLAEDRVVDGVYAVLKKQKLRTRSGAPYLALELGDSTGRISGRVWNDVELLDARFGEGDAVHVLGRVEKFRDRLQLEVRALEPADADPAALAPALRRDADELEGFVDVPHVGDPRRVAARARRGACSQKRRCARTRPRSTATTRTPAGCSSTRSAWRRSATSSRSSIRACARDLLLAAALVHDVGRTRELGPPPAFRPTEEGRLLGHVHLGLRAARGARARRRSCCTPSRCTTTCARRAPPRLRRCTTRTSSTPSPRPGPDSRNRPGARTRARASRGASPTSSGRSRDARSARSACCSRAQVAGLPRSRSRCSIHGEAPHDAEVLLAIPAALSGTLGLWAYYRGMAVGAMSVVAPIAGISAIVPVTVGLATGDDPSAAQIAGIFVALIGVGLASREHQAGDRRVAAGVGLALLAAIGFGGYFVPMHAAGAADFWWASLVFRTTSFALIAVAALAARRSVRVSRRDAVLRRRRSASATRSATSSSPRRRRTASSA